MVVDALASYIFRSLAPKVLNIQDKPVLIFHKEVFQLPKPLQC